MRFLPAKLKIIKNYRPTKLQAELQKYKKEVNVLSLQNR